jgi:hypothetical protein
VDKFSENLENGVVFNSGFSKNRDRASMACQVIQELEKYDRFDHSRFFENPDRPADDPFRFS